MSRMLKPAAAGLAVSSLCLSFIAETPAQTSAKKKPTVVQTQAQNDEAPRTRPRTGGAPAADSAESKSPADGAKSGKMARPEGQLLRVAKIDPELEKILQDWERHTSQFKKLKGEFSVFKYDNTFEIERRGTGTFAHEAPDKGNYERKGVEIAKGEKSKKKGKDGELYELKSDTAERWVCTGKEIIKIDEQERTYEKIPIPPEAQGQNIIDGPLPFLFGMKADQAKRRYKMKLVKEKTTESTIWLEVRPLRGSDASNWERAVVIIDAKRFVPKAVQLFDPTGSETVHVFENIEINPRTGWFQQDPFKPSLRNYKPALTGDLQSAAGEKPLAPSKNRPAVEGMKRTANGSDAPVRKTSATK